MPGAGLVSELEPEAAAAELVLPACSKTFMCPSVLLISGEILPVEGQKAPARLRDPPEASSLAAPSNHGQCLMQGGPRAAGRSNVGFTSGIFPAPSGLCLLRMPLSGGGRPAAPVLLFRVIYCAERSFPTSLLCGWVLICNIVLSSALASCAGD